MWRAGPVSVDNWIEFWKNHDGTGYHEQDRNVMEAWAGFGFAIESSKEPIKRNAICCILGSGQCRT
jgi:hypothetical protein